VCDLLTLDTLHAYLSATPRARRWTAPSGYMYEIYGFHFINQTAVSNTVFVFDRYIEEEHSQYVDTEGGQIIAFRCDTDGIMSSPMFPEPLKAKHISIGYSVASQITAHIYIFVKLVKASKVELIYEFISRGKSA
jgi:hypothetical protein